MSESNSVIEISFDDSVEVSEVVALYAANGWSSAEKPEELMVGLRNSHSLVTTQRKRSITQRTMDSCLNLSSQLFTTKLSAEVDQRIDKYRRPLVAELSH